MLNSRVWIAGLALVGFSLNLFSGANVGRAAEPADDVGAMASKALNYLATQQGADGSFSPQAGPAVTALVLYAALQNGRTPEDPMIAKGMKYLDTFVQEDGGIYKEDSFHKNYETSVALMVYAAANRSGKYDATVKKAEAFVKDIQFDTGEGKSKDDIEYGGAGYGRHKRPDLSNTAFFLDALKSVGNDANDEAIQRALIFVSRCQNLESEFNNTPLASKVNDGGFFYTPIGGNNPAGETENGGLRSYGSMTYTGLKSMIYAGLDEKDPRVKAAMSWAKKNYSLEQNPGMGDAGLYYYYQAMAKALAASKTDVFVTEDGTKHEWKKEILAQLKKRQNANGSWVNSQPRWMEGDANLVTAYALLTLTYCK